MKNELSSSPAENILHSLSNLVLLHFVIVGALLIIPILSSFLVLLAFSVAISGTSIWYSISSQQN
jgi:hypothetical protein